jgi:ubiquinone/menaquinone biosynthesis C-methylase UbiE
MRWRRDGTTRPGGYEEQAETYDLTRGASPTIVELVSRHLGPGHGGTLVDIAGGTGNYAGEMRDLGFRVTVVDASVEMTRRSVAKVGPGRQVVGDAAALPFADEAFDAAMCVIAIHLFDDRRAAFREARRVVQGPFVVVAYTRENLESLFVQEYFGGWWPDAEGFSAEDVEGELEEAGFTETSVETFVYKDAVGGSLVAMHTDPRLLADPDRLRNTSFWHRYPDDVRQAALARLDADLRSGALAERVKDSLAKAAKAGHGTVFAARP